MKVDLHTQKQLVAGIDPGQSIADCLALSHSYDYLHTGPRPRYGLLSV